MGAIGTIRLLDVVAAWRSWMEPMFWQVAIAVLLLSVAELCCSSRPARLRYCLWLLLLIRLVLPPHVAAPTCWRWWLGPERLVAWHDAWLPPVRPRWETPPLAWAPGSPTARLSSAEAFSPPPAWRAGSTTNDAVAAQSELTLLVWSALFLIWLIGLIVRVKQWLFGWLQIRKWLRQAPLLNDEDYDAILADAAAEAGWRGPFAVAISDTCPAPFVWGTTSPTLVLPRQLLRRATPEELEALLVHLLCHVRRRDGLFATLQELLESVFWFHPAIWWARLRLRYVREAGCDEATVAAIGKRWVCGQVVKKAAEVCGTCGLPAALGVLDSSEPLDIRSRRLLAPYLPIEPLSGFGTAVILVVVGLVILPAGAPPPDPTPSELAPRSSEIHTTDSPDPRGERQVTNYQFDPP